MASREQRLLPIPLPTCLVSALVLSFTEKLLAPQIKPREARSQVSHCNLHPEIRCGAALAEEAV